MTGSTTFEVQVQQNGRWSIHATFLAHQKSAAIDEGRELDRLSTVDAVKVIKEVYDPELDVHNEFIVYKSPGLKSTGASGGKSSSSSSSSSYSRRPSARDESWLTQDKGESKGAAQPRRRAATSKQPSTLTAVVVKLLLVLLFSLVLAAALSFVAEELFGGTIILGMSITGNAESNMLIGVFISTFLITALSLTISVMRGQTLENSRKRRGQSQQAPQRPGKAPPKKMPAAAPPPVDAGTSATAGPSQELMEGGAATNADTMASLDQAMKGVEEFKVEPATTPEQAAENDALTDRLREKLGQEKEQPSQENTGRGVVLDAATHGKPESAPRVEPLSPAGEKQKSYMMGFLSKGLEGSQTDQKKMDNFNKFGVNLFLAGACEILSQNKELDVKTRSRILSDAVQVMGFKKSHAASFADKYEEYLMADARYMQMFQAGRNAMNIFTSEETAAPRLLDNALIEWNKPKAREEQSGPITVLFTDIAGSTAMTQALGDAGAQQVVRAHNRIVREALSANAGKEVKHTGDGIMASFTKTSDGVDASIEMQKGTALHNQQNPDLPLHLKIGLNAGEPIAEDNDLFGTTVQLSARIVDKASADEIFVSEIVRGICAGKNYQFTNRGGFPMKGFGDDITLFEVMWHDIEGEVESPPTATTTTTE
ncbi:MAG: adenylate/guanylate cyclase domain-containing protein [Rhodospirillales bacterium]|nr:adenylate/guanylate cyclase domain-containing protein [Rhodospirillales bacterium]